MVDEIDTRDGSLVYRIISDLPDPIIRIEVTCSDKGHEYLLLLSAVNELRIWDIENRFHLAAVNLSGGRRALPSISSMTVTNFQNRCLLLYSRAGSPVVEALHIQRQIDHPGSAHLLTLLEPKVILDKRAYVCSISSHNSLPLIAVGTSDGTVTCFHAPFLSDSPASTASSGPVADGGIAAQTSIQEQDDEDDDLSGPAKAKSVKSKSASNVGAAGGSSAAAAGPSDGGGHGQAGVAGRDRDAATILFAAAISPDYTIVQGRIRKAGGVGGPGAASAAASGSEYNDCVTCLAFHPTLPLLAASDGSGRIVVYRVGLNDGFHAAVASRDWAAPNTRDECMRLITSMVFHPTLPRLVTLAYSPQNPFYAPEINAWCTAHAGLPPMPSPVTPSLAALMTSAVQDPASQAIAHVAQPPSMLSQSSASCHRSVVIYVNGRAIVTSDIAASSSNVGVGPEDDGVADDAFGNAWEPGPNYGVIAPLQPTHGTGISYSAPVCDVVSAPRSWFVTGGEGDGQEIGADDIAAGAHADASKAADDLNTGSLADFAARLAAAASGKSEKKEGGAGGGGASDSADADKGPLGFKRRQLPPEQRVSVDAVVYVQTRTEAVAMPPRVAIQHSLQVRQLGVPHPSRTDGADDSGSTVPGGNDRDSTSAVKRICWLPSYGPGGPLQPLSVQRSPSGRYFLVRFAYATEMSPAVAARSVHDAAAAAIEAAKTAAANGDKAAVAHAMQVASEAPPIPIDFTSPGAAINTAGTPAEGNAAAYASPEMCMYVVVGPVDCEVDPVTGKPVRPDPKSSATEDGQGVNFRVIRSDVAVSHLQTSVDASFLYGDRLLVVRRPTVPAAAALAASEKGASMTSTAYNVSIEALDYDWEAHDREEQERMKEQQEKERLEKEKHKGLEKISDMFKGLGHLGSSMSEKSDKERAEKEAKDKAEKEKASLPPLRTDPYRVPLRFAVHDPVSRVFPTPFRAPVPLTSSSLAVDESDTFNAATSSPAAATASATGGSGSARSIASSESHGPELGDAHAQQHASVPLLPPGAKTAHGITDGSIAGDVLLFATRFKSEGADESEYRLHGHSASSTGSDRIVLRYSNNAFGPYDVRNPHGYAIVDAYERAALKHRSATGGQDAGKDAKKKDGKKGQHQQDDPADRPEYGLLALKRVGESAANAEDGIGHQGTASLPGAHGKGRSGSGSGNVLPSPHGAHPPPSSARRGSFGHGGYHGDVMLDADAWREHEANGARCPVTIRPALILAPGEMVSRITWQAPEAVWGDAGSHDPSLEPAWTAAASSTSDGHKGIGGLRRPGAPPLPDSQSHHHGKPFAGPIPRKQVPSRLTLPMAIAQGGPLLAILTTHRLIIATPALQLLAAVPILAPMSGSIGVGLGHVCTSGGDGSHASTALACSDFGVWRGTFASPHGHGHGYGRYAYDGAPGKQAAIVSATEAAASGLDVTAGADAAGPASRRSSAVSQRSEGRNTHATASVAGGDGDHESAAVIVALGAGYTGTVDDSAVIVGAAAASIASRLDHPLPISSPQFGVPTAGVAPSDSSASYSGGILTNTVAGAAASAARLINPLPASRLTDTVAQDDIPDELLSQVGWRSPVVSHAWAGSALLFTTGTGEVWYMTPTGRVRRVASLEQWQRDAVLVAATPDRLVYASSHWRSGRVQVRSRAISPLEPLLASALDHSVTRPKPLMSLLGVTSPRTLPEAPPHPVVAALAHTLSLAIVVYGQVDVSAALKQPSSSVRGKDSKSTAAPVKVMYLTGQTAVAGAALAALARDYSHVRDLVARYAHPKRIGGGGASAHVAFKEDVHSSFGVTRAVVACLEERGLLDLASYCAQGHPHGADKGKDQYEATGGGHHHDSRGVDGDEDVGDNDLSASAKQWLDETGYRRKASIIPWSWRASLAIKRGRIDHAVWALCGEDPSLASTIVELTKHRAGSGAGLEADVDTSHLRLPSPASPVAARLRVLGRVCANVGNFRASLLCFDIAGDHAGAFWTLVLASASAVMRAASDQASKTKKRASLDDDEDEHDDSSHGSKFGVVPGVEGSLSQADVEEALAALLGPNKDRYPATAVAVALRRKAVADDAPVLLRKAKELHHAKKQLRRKHRHEGDDDDDASTDEDDDAYHGSRHDVADDHVLDTSSMLDSIRGQVYPPAVGGRKERAEALLHLDYSIGTSAAAVVTKAKQMLELSPALAAPALALCPYLCLADSTLQAMLKVGEETARRTAASAAASASSGIAAVAGGPAAVPVPVPTATLHAQLSLTGGTINPEPAPVLPPMHAPLSLDSLQRWIGTTAPGIAKGGHRKGGDAGGSGEGDEDDEDADAAGSLEAMLGLPGAQSAAAAAEQADPYAWAQLVSRGKKKLRALPRGAEDAVLGYWRFERPDEEIAAAAVRERDLKRSKTDPTVVGGVWCISNGSKESVSPWPEPVLDLSKQQNHGSLFDALVLLARVKGVAGARDSVSYSAIAAAVAKGPGTSELGPLVRAGWGSTCDAPFDPGDPTKVKEPRCLVAGVATVHEVTDKAIGGGDKSKAQQQKHAVIPVPGAVQIELSELVQPGAVADKGVPGLPPQVLTPALRLLSSLYSWAVAVPIRRFTYLDLGLRPFDPVNSVFTIETWVKAGNPYPSADSSSSFDAPAAGGDDDDAGAGGTDDDTATPTPGGGRRSGPSYRPACDLIIMSRTERALASNNPKLRVQWQLGVRADGSLAFTAFPDGADHSELDSPKGVSTVVATQSGVLPFGEWRHVAAVIDASAAAKEVAARLKSAGTIAEKSGPTAPGATPSSAPLPPALLRLFIDGDQVEEGQIRTAMPLPLIDDREIIPSSPAADEGGQSFVPNKSAAAGTCDHLCLAPDFVGRLGEVRVWAKKRSGDELSDTKDFHLDLAESKRTKMNIQIRAAPVKAPAAAAAAGPASTSVPIALAVGTPASPATPGGTGTPAAGAQGTAASGAAGSGVGAIKKLGGLAGPGAASAGIVQPARRRLAGAGAAGAGTPIATNPVAGGSSGSASGSAASVAGGDDDFGFDAAAAPPAPPAGAESQSSSSAGFGFGEDDEGASSGAPVATAKSASAIGATDGDEDEQRPKPSLALKKPLGVGSSAAPSSSSSSLGLKAPGGAGLGAALPPSASGAAGGKKAAMMKARAAAAAAASGSGGSASS